MANIRKTFNFREGVKVDDNVLVVAGARVGIGSTIPTKTFDVNGNATFNGQIESSKLVVSGVSTFSDVGIGTEISIESSSGIITAAKFYGDASSLSNLPTSQWTDVDVGLGFTSIYNSGNVGVGTTDPRFTLQIGSDNRTVGQEGVGIDGITGNIKSSGIITATKFVGDGSSLTGITGTIVSGTVANATNAVYATTAGISTTSEGLTGYPSISVTGIAGTSASFTGVVTSSSFSGALNGNAATATTATNAQGLTGTPNIIVGIGSFNSIGIGTENPATDIQIVNSANSVITLGRENSATGNNGAIGFGKVSSSFPYSSATSLDIINYGIGNVNFYLEAGTTGSSVGDFHWHRRGNFARLMTLTSGGNLGIGITQPINKLHVAGVSTVTSDAYFGNDINVKGDIVTIGGITGSIINGEINAAKFDTNPSGVVITGVATASGGFGGNLTGNADTATTASGLTTIASVNTAGIITATGGFISAASTTAVQITVSGNILTFTATGIGSTSFTLS